MRCRIADRALAVIRRRIVVGDASADDDLRAGADWAEDGTGVAIAVGCVARRKSVEEMSMDKYDLAMAVHMFHPRAIGDVLKILVEAYEQFKASKV